MANSQLHGPIARMPEAIVGPSVKAVATTIALRPKPRPCKPPRINGANQRGIHTHNTTGAEALQHARRQQAGQRPRTRAEQRCRREQHKTSEVDPVVTDDFAKRGERQKGCDHRNLVDIHYPDDFGWAGMKIGCYCWESDVRDRRVERGHRKRGKNGSGRAHLRRCAGRPLIATGPFAEIVSVDIRKALQYGFVERIGSGKQAPLCMTRMRLL